MSSATTLTQAAGLASDNLSVWFAIGNAAAKVRLQSFTDQINGLFPAVNGTPNTQSIQNWVSVMYATLAQIGPTTPARSMVALDDTAQLVYRMCWDTQQLLNNGTITAGQATAVLGAYNGQLAAP